MAALFSEASAPAVVQVIKSLGSNFLNTVYKSVYQVGSGPLLGVEFSNNSSGSKDFVLRFSDHANIEKNDLIKIKVFGSPNDFFTGVVRNAPILGSTDTEFIYSGFGLVDYLGRISTESLSYSSELVEDIVKDIAENIIAVKTDIKYSASSIDATGVTVSSIDFDYTQVSEAIKQLKELAQASGNQYIAGVSSSGTFFFQERSSLTVQTLVAGKNSSVGIPYYNPTDENEARTKYFIKKKDGTFYGTVSSLIENDIFEETITAPDIADADLTAWATGILTESEVSTRQASIEWDIPPDRSIPLVSNGYLRIISNYPGKNIETIESSTYGSGAFGSDLFGGQQAGSNYLDDTLRILGVKYKINDSMAKMFIQLGQDPATLGAHILRIRSELKNLKISLGV